MTYQVTSTVDIKGVVHTWVKGHIKVILGHDYKVQPFFCLFVCCFCIGVKIKY